MFAKYRALISSTYKSKDTEEWIDVWYTRPIGLLWTLAFKKLGIAPNVVTILSMVIGVAAGWMFCYTDFLHNALGVVLLAWANFYDSADGQLARLTGKKTRWGRMLDGFAGDVWFAAIYLAIVYRLWNEPIPLLHLHWGVAVLALTVISALCHARQCQLADYYRNVHMYFSFGDGSSELDNSETQRQKMRELPCKGNFWWRVFLFFYSRYTRSQEQMTPCLQKLLKTIRNDRNNVAPDGFRLDFRKESKPMMKYANILTFNCRAITLYVACLLNIPWLYIAVEIIGFTLLALWLRKCHESLCSHILMLLDEGYYDNEPLLKDSYATENK